MKEVCLPDRRFAKVHEFHTKPGGNAFFAVLLNPGGVRTIFHCRAVSIFQAGNRLFVR
jgi:hypothetical protein